MRINLLAGPGSGKSTTAAYIFSQLKMKGYSIELVSEYVKSWAIAKKTVNEFDQIYLLGKQLQYEYRFLSNGIQNIITDSPVILSAFYTRAYYPNMLGIAHHMEQIILEYERAHPAINIFLNRGDKEYKTEGRYQTEEQAHAIDNLILDSLERLEVPFTAIDFRDQDFILNYIESQLTHE